MNRLQRAAALVLVFSLAAAGFGNLRVPAEQIETFGPELAAEGGFLGGDGGRPERPAGWDFELRGDAEVAWEQKGFRDKGSARLLCRDYESACSIFQKRWLSSPAPCYLLQYACRGAGTSLSVELALVAESGTVLCSARAEEPLYAGWRTGRLYLEPFPPGLEGELKVSFSLSSKGEAWVDAVSLRRYEGPWSRRERKHDGRMPVSPAAGARAAAPVLFTWPAVPFAERYVLRLADGRGFPLGRYAKIVTPACFVLAEPKAGACTWTVSAVAPGGREYVLVEPASFEVLLGGRLSLSPRPPEYPLPGSPDDYASWRASRTVPVIVSRAAELPAPPLAPPELPQGGRARERLLFRLNAAWRSAASRLLTFSAASACGAGEADARARKLLAEMAERAPAAAPLLSAGTKSAAALAAVSASRFAAALAAGLCDRLLPPEPKILAAVGRDTLDYDAFRLLCARFTALAAGAVRGDVAPSAAGVAAVFSEWFPKDASSPLPPALLAADFPLFYSAARLAGEMLPSLCGDFEVRVSRSAASLAEDFPLAGGASFGDTVPAAAERAASLLAFLAGKREAAVPPWAWTGTSPAWTSGLFPLEPSAFPKKLAPAGTVFDTETGFARAGSTLLGTFCGFRASSWGTSPPFGAAQGHFSFSWRGEPVAGFLPLFQDGVPVSAAAGRRSFASSQYLGPADFLYSRLSHSADARVVSVRGAGSCFLAEADLAPCFIDFFRRAERTVAFVAPPSGPPFAACRDTFSTWFNSPVAVSFRLAGKREKIDAVAQKALSVSSALGRTALLVARPAGCGMAPGKGDFRPFGIAAEPSFSVTVRPPRNAGECLSVLLPLAGKDEDELRPLPGEDTAGAFLPGGGLCAFRPESGGVWPAGSVLSDAAFVALLPQPGGRFFLFAAGASEVDVRERALVRSGAPADFALLFEEGGDGLRVLDCFASTARETTAVLGSGKSAKKITFGADGRMYAGRKPQLPPSPDASLFKGDRVGKPLVEPLSPDLRLACFPAFLSGSYRVRLVLTGKRGDRAALRAGGLRFEDVELDSPREELSLRNDFLGPVAFLARLPRGVRIRRVLIEKDYLPQGGFERWSAGRPAGFVLRPSSARVSRDTSRVFEGKSSLHVTLRGKQKVELSARIPFRGRRLNASARAFILTEGEKDLFVRLGVIPVDSTGKRGAPVMGRPVSSQRRWNAVSLSASLPKTAKEVILLVSMEGEGGVWLDDLSVSD